MVCGPEGWSTETNQPIRGQQYYKLTNPEADWNIFSLKILVQTMRHPGGSYGRPLHCLLSLVLLITRSELMFNAPRD